MLRTLPVDVARQPEKPAEETQQDAPTASAVLLRPPQVPIVLLSLLLFWSGRTLYQRLQSRALGASPTRVTRVRVQVNSVVLLVEQQDLLDFHPRWIGIEGPAQTQLQSYCLVRDKCLLEMYVNEELPRPFVLESVILTFVVCELPNKLS